MFKGHVEKLYEKRDEGPIRRLCMRWFESIIKTHLRIYSNTQLKTQLKMWIKLFERQV